MRAEGLGCLMVASSWIAKWLQGELVRTEVLGCLMNATSWIVKWLQGELVRTEVLGCSSFDSVRSRILLKRVSQIKPGVSPKVIVHPCFCRQITLGSVSMVFSSITRALTMSIRCTFSSVFRVIARSS